jgi:hypothetical protein
LIRRTTGQLRRHVQLTFFSSPFPNLGIFPALGVCGWMAKNCYLNVTMKVRKTFVPMDVADIDLSTAFYGSLMAAMIGSMRKRLNSHSRSLGLR